MRRLLMHLRSQRGASAVEFALVVPLLLVLLLGTVEFGRVFNTQLQLTSAARESVRVMAISKDPVVARETAKLATNLNPALTDANISFLGETCGTGTDATVTISYSASLLSGLFADAVPLSARAVMRCGG